MQIHAFLLSVLGFAVAAPAQAQLTTLVPVADSTLYEDPAGAFANGAGEGLFVGRIASGLRRRAIVKFDVAAALQAGARVVDVELLVTVSRGFAPGLVKTSLHRITTPWSEGPSDATLFREGQGILSVVGDNTWLHNSFPSAFWAVPGGDYVATASGFGFAPTLGPVVFASTTAMVADVQQWIDAPATNAGWCMRTDELVNQDARRYESRQTSVPGAGPRLRIRWIQPGGSAAVGAGCGAPAPTLALGGALQAGGSFTATVQGNPGGIVALLLDGGLVQPPVEALPSCFAYLGATAVSAGLAMLDGAGAATYAFAIPPSPLFSGFTVGLQAAVFDATQPSGIGVTNAVVAVVL